MEEHVPASHPVPDPEIGPFAWMASAVEALRRCEQQRLAMVPMLVGGVQRMVVCYISDDGERIMPLLPLFRGDDRLEPLFGGGAVSDVPAEGIMALADVILGNEGFLSDIAKISFGLENADLWVKASGEDRGSVALEKPDAWKTGWIGIRVDAAKIKDVGQMTTDIVGYMANLVAKDVFKDINLITAAHLGMIAIKRG
jgi:hypothetical protein